MADKRETKDNGQSGFVKRQENTRLDGYVRREAIRKREKSIGRRGENMTDKKAEETTIRKNIGMEDGYVLRNQKTNERNRKGEMRKEDKRED